MDLYEDREIVEMYLSECGPNAPMPALSGVNEVEIDGVPYVVLANVTGTLAVMGTDGFLDTTQWPAELVD